MANTAQAKKRVPHTARPTMVDRDRRSRIRNFVKKVELAISSGDKSVAEAALRAAEPEIMRGVTKGILHKNTASRKVSRLSHRIVSLG